MIKIPTIMEIVIIVILLSTVFIGGIIKHYNRKKGEDLLTGKRTLDSKTLIITTRVCTILLNVIFVFIVPILMIFDIYYLLMGWASVYFLLPTDWIFFFQIVGLVLYVLGYTIYALGRIELGGMYSDLWEEVKIGEGIKKTGIFSKMRHPLYGGGVIFELGIVILFQTWLGLLLFIPLSIIMVRQAYKEEQWLIENYEDEYKAYMKKTWRFFPKLW
ncbi:MAG: hypothetical protein GF329_11475 [Candidatus Lokiarchaeota archaeon]|nr:hypothetical protein [Candidatus Lokiarchaeota archaeon]